ncbi:unnamed protein product, partial [Rangifer tarandus platyrhynchus]
MERRRKAATLSGALAFCGGTEATSHGRSGRVNDLPQMSSPLCDPFRGLPLGGSQREARRAEDLLRDSTQSSFLGPK